MTELERKPSTPSIRARQSDSAESAGIHRRAVEDNDEILAVVGMLQGQRLARAVETAAELGVADLVAQGPRSIDDLAEATGSHAPSLCRLLRALSAHGLFEELGGQHFAQTPRSATLTSTHARSLRDSARMLGSEWEWRSWGAFPHSIRTGQPSFDAVYGTSLWQYFDDVDPAAGAVFDAAMTSVSSRLTPAIVEAYDFSAFATLVDVGGGHGHLLAAVLQANPRLRGVLFDRPATVAALHDDLRAPGVAERVEVVAGSFFDRVPPGADAYLVKFVLHDWDDESAGQILSRLREAVPAHGRVLVVEHVLSRGTASPDAGLLDLEMLKNHAGRERTEDEFRILLSAAGFELTHVVPAGPLSILVARTG
jgi:O-methyltransferase domain